MGITVNWDDQTDQALDSIEVYRSLTPIDINNPPAPLVTLPANARSYEDNSVKVGNTYYYCVAVVKGANRSFGAVQTQGYYANLGPGPQKVIRGDWQRGYFGEFSASDWVTALDVTNKIKDVLKATAGVTLSTSTNNTWTKFIYKGKILYIPSVNLITASWNNAYNAGFLFGTDDFGNTPAGVPGAVNQKMVIDIAGQSFLVRSIRFSDKPFTEYLTDPADFNTGEWKSTHARLLRADASTINDPSIMPRFNDATSIVGSASPHHGTATTVTSVSSGAPETLVTNTNKTTNVQWLVVLELMQ